MAPINILVRIHLVIQPQKDGPSGMGPRRGESGCGSKGLMHGEMLQGTGGCTGWLGHHHHRTSLILGVREHVCKS